MEEDCRHRSGVQNAMGSAQLVVCRAPKTAPSRRTSSASTSMRAEQIEAWIKAQKRHSQTARDETAPRRERVRPVVAIAKPRRAAAR